MTAEYAFRVVGRLTPGLLGALDPLAASPARTETVLLGTVADQSELHGYIGRIEALGLELVGVQQLPHRGTGTCADCGRAVASEGPGMPAAPRPST